MTDEQIRQRLKELCKAPIQTIPAVVLEVDEENFTIDVKPLSGAEMFEVRLKAGIDGVKDGMVEFPAKDSTVLIGLIGNDKHTAFVLKCSKVDKIVIRIGSISLIMTKDEITMNDGSLGGLVNIADLVGKLNTIEQDINSLKTAFSSWVPVPQDGGSALKTAVGSWFGSQLVQTTKNDLEDPKIIH
jgi:hypothetical protein